PFQNTALKSDRNKTLQWNNAIVGNHPSTPLRTPISSHPRARVRNLRNGGSMIQRKGLAPLLLRVVVFVIATKNVDHVSSQVHPFRPMAVDSPDIHEPWWSPPSNRHPSSFAPFMSQLRHSNADGDSGVVQATDPSVRNRAAALTVISDITDELKSNIGNALVPGTELSQKQQVNNNCTAGFHCPENTFVPIYCCAGYYCPNPTEIYLCPVNHYCPIGSTQALNCNFLSACPEGTSQVSRFGILAILVVVFGVFLLGFRWRAAIIARRNLKYQERLKRIMANQKPLDDASFSDSKEQLHHEDSNTWIEDEESDDEEPPLSPGFANAMGGVAVDVSDSSTPVSIGAKQDQRTFDVSFENLGLVLPNGVEIMAGISGELKSGRMCAIMGPSGAGKTTFVSLLTGKAKRTSGVVRINGKEDELSHYKKLIGFVPQEDIMLRELTVRDILMHSAMMRLPAKWSAKEKKEHVLEVISYLGLSHVMDSAIGNEEERGISGGQRKRVNIGMELVANPSVLFLDEPTSGLDSATSYEVCTMLRGITRGPQRMTVAAVIHSPSPQAFEQFDDLLLLGKGGRIIYFGPRANALDYFAKIGFECPHGYNPADFFMDVATGRVPCRLTPVFKPHQLFFAWERYMRGDHPQKGILSTGATTVKLSASNPNAALLGRAKTVRGKKKSQNVVAVAGQGFVDMLRGFGAWFADIGEELWGNLRQMFTRNPIRRTPNQFVIFVLCYHRAVRQLYRSPSAFLFDQLVHLICGVFISVASQSTTYLGIQPTQVCDVSPPTLQELCKRPVDLMQSTGIFISLGVLFAGITVGTSTFGNEKVVFWRDTAAGMPCLPYFLAKIIADVPRMVIATFMFGISLVLFLPFRQTVYGLLLVILLLYFVAFGMGYFLTAFLPRSSVSLAATGFVLIWSMGLSGVQPPLTSIMSNNFYKHLRWLWYISSPRWAIEAFYIGEAKNREWIEFTRGDLSHGYSFSNYGTAMWVQTVIGVGWMFLAYLGMKGMHRDKQK
ncbi:hypothetical protein HK102_011342, partial [Quaeritorhiza haematococci]